jgi:hypothetical protein
MPSRMMAQASKTTDAAANIVTPLTLTEVRSLHFGTMSVLAGTAGTATVTTSSDGTATVPGGIGTRSQTAGVNLSSAAPAYHNAAYTVGGSASTTYAITLPATITVSGAGAPMIINSVVARTFSSAAEGTTGTLSAGGSDTFTVGGVLPVAAAQVAGLYTGTFNVTVAYN